VHLDLAEPGEDKWAESVWSWKENTKWPADDELSQLPATVQGDVAEPGGDKWAESTWSRKEDDWSWKEDEWSRNTGQLALQSPQSAQSAATLVKQVQQQQVFGQQQQQQKQHNGSAQMWEREGLSQSMQGAQAREKQKEEEENEAQKKLAITNIRTARLAEKQIASRNKNQAVVASTEEIDMKRQDEQTTENDEQGNGTHRAAKLQKDVETQNKEEARIRLEIKYRARMEGHRKNQHEGAKVKVELGGTYVEDDRKTAETKTEGLMQEESLHLHIRTKWVSWVSFGGHAFGCGGFSFCVFC
jgi:hypothetical protein